MRSYYQILTWPNKFLHEYFTFRDNQNKKRKKAKWKQYRVPLKNNNNNERHLKELKTANKYVSREQIEQRNKGKIRRKQLHHI